MTGPFPDLSNYQSGSNVAAILVALGSDRALYKATEGKAYKASTFPGFVDVTVALGKKVGAYHFARPSQGGSGAASAEASWHAAVIRAAGFSPNNRDSHWSCYDFEDPDLDQKVAVNAAIARSHAINFCNTMSVLGWTTGVIYGSYPYLNWAGLTSAMLPAGWRQLHIANYGQTPDDQVTLPNGWSRSQVVARQYTSTATVPGATTKIDVSHFDREWLVGNGADSVAYADDQLSALQGAINGVNPSDFAHQFMAIYWAINKLANDPVAGSATMQQAGAIGQNVSATRAEIAALRADLDAFIRGGGIVAPQIDLDVLAGKVVDALTARLLAGMPPAPQHAAVVNASQVWQGVSTADQGSIYDQLMGEQHAAPTTPTVLPPSEQPRPMVECQRDARICPNPVEVGPYLDGSPSDWVCGCPPVQGPDVE